jgi:uncharacterized protein
MFLLDVNVIVGAMRTDAPRHGVMRRTLDTLRQSPEPFALCDVVLSGAIRVLSHPRVFAPPTPLTETMLFVRLLRESPSAVVLAPGARHWELFTSLIENASATGNLVTDAWIGALAMEHGCTVLSDDADFARLAGVRWQRPG